MDVRRLRRVLAREPAVDRRRTTLRAPPARRRLAAKDLDRAERVRLAERDRDRLIVGISWLYTYPRKKLFFNLN